MGVKGIVQNSVQDHAWTRPHLREMESCVPSLAFYHLRIRPHRSRYVVHLKGSPYGPYQLTLFDSPGPSYNAP